MIEATATVIALEEDDLILQAETRSACGGCAVRQGCGTSVLAKTVGKKFTHFRVRNTVHANIGDQLVLGLPEDVLLVGSLAIYLLPLLALVLFSLVADFLLGGSVQSNDFLIALTGLSGLGLGVFVSRKYLTQAHMAARYTPVILRKNLLAYSESSEPI